MKNTLRWVEPLAFWVAGFVAGAVFAPSIAVAVAGKPAPWAALAIGGAVLLFGFSLAAARAAELHRSR